MIKIQFDIKTDRAVRRVFVEDPEYFITKEQAQAFIDEPQNQKWLINAEIVDVIIKKLE